MAKEVDTISGKVLVESSGPGRWSVTLKRGNRFMGTIELEGGGRYTAAPLGGSSQSCPDLRAAARVVGTSGYVL